MADRRRTRSRRTLLAVALSALPLPAQSLPAPPMLETLGTAVRGHRGAVLAATFGPAALAATAGAEGSLRIWDTATGALRRSIAAGSGIRGLAFDTSGRTVTASGHDGNVRTWDVQSGKLLAETALPAAISHPAPGGGGAALAAEPEAIELFDRAGTRTGRIRLPPAGFGQIAWSADGRRLAAASTRQPWVYAWDVPASRPCLDQQMIFRPIGLAFSPDGQTLAVCKQGWVELRPLDGGREMRRILVAGTPCRASFTPDGRTLVVGTSDGRVEWRNVADARHLAGGWEHRAEVTAVAASADGQLALSGSTDGSVRFWSLAQGGEAHPAYGHNNQITALAFAPDGRHLLSGAWNGTVQVWDLATGAVALRMEHKPHVRGVGFLADGSFVSAGADNTLRIWSARDGKELRRFQGPGDTEEIRRLSLDRTGTRLVTSHDRGKAALWDHRRGLLRTFVQHAEGAALSPDGDRLVTGGDRLRSWAVDPPAGSGTGGGASSFGPIAFLGPDQVVCIQDAALVTWQLGQNDAVTRTRHAAALHHLAASERTGLVAVAGEDAVHVHDASWDETFRIPAVDSPPSALAWSADGRILAVGWSNALIGVYLIAR